jgi:predicted lipoprotein with Yx(FWY)xxD motif
MLRLTLPARLLGTASVAFLVAACASQGGGGPTSTPAAGTPAASGAPGGAGTVYTVEVHQDATLGAFLTGQDGRSLYLLTKDSAGTSTCQGSCASAWPPFTLEAGETVAAGAGVTGTLGTIKRPDGTDQVAINGIPLYYYAGDSGPNQTNGQGVQGVWFLVSPSGAAVGAPAGTTAPTQGYSRYSY